MQSFSKHSRIAIAALLACAFWVAASAHAQTPPPPMPPATLPAADPAAMTPPPVPVAAATATPEPVLFAKPQYRKVKSLFFSPAEITDIRLALNTYKKHFSGQVDDADFNEEDFLNQLAGLRRSPKTNRFFVYPQFFLDSIVYHGKTNWVIWINGIKYTQDSDQENAEIRVLELDENKVSLEWHPVAMDRVNAVWDRTPNEEIIVDKQRGQVEFTLRPNQTFSSYVMRVLEGKVQSITVDNNIAGITEEGDAEAENPEPAPPQAAPAQPESREGLGGLMNAYSKLREGQDALKGQKTPPIPLTPPPQPIQEKKP